MTNLKTEPVGVIIVNWNSWLLSLACLDSLRTTVGAEWHLFLVDNASTDGSRAHLIDLGEDVTVVLSDTNGGWTGGNNLGVRAALEAGYNQIFILNNDAQVKPDTIRLLATRSAAGSPSPILGPIHLDGGGTPDFIGASMDRATGMPVLMKAHETDVSVLDPVYPTAYIRGAGIFATRQHFFEVQLFDDAFYLNYDETDWCFRARALGFAVSMMRDAEIIHIGSASIGGALSPLNVYFIVRNGLLFAEKHCAPVQRIRQAAALFRSLGTMQGDGSRFRRLCVLLWGSDPRAIAARRGASDYLFRRFGNCPPMIRALSAAR